MTITVPLGLAIIGCSRRTPRESGAPGASAAAPSASARVAPLTLDQTREKLGPEARIAFDRLLGATGFENSAVGVGGTLSKNAAAARRLIREGEAPRAFQVLFDQGTVVSRLYALCAFWYLAPADFPKLVETVGSTDGEKEVAATFGCMASHLKVSELLKSSHAENALRLAPGADRYDLMCRSPREPYSTDLAGGGLPIEIIEGASIAEKDCENPPPRPWYLKPR